MEVTRDNLKYAYEHMKREWEFYWEQSKGNPRWVCNPQMDIQEGDMVYVQLDVGSLVKCALDIGAMLSKI